MKLEIDGGPIFSLQIKYESCYFILLLRLVVELIHHKLFDFPAAVSRAECVVVVSRPGNWNTVLDAAFIWSYTTTQISSACQA